MRNENRSNQIVYMFNDVESEPLRSSGAGAWTLFILRISYSKETSKIVGTHCSKIFFDMASLSIAANYGWQTQCR